MQMVHVNYLRCCADKIGVKAQVHKHGVGILTVMITHHCMWQHCIRSREEVVMLVIYDYHNFFFHAQINFRNRGITGSNRGIE